MSSDLTYDFKINTDNNSSAYYWQLRFLDQANSVLDIGCATGFFGRYLVEHGCRVVGIEQSSEAAEKARSVYQRVIVGDVEIPEVKTQIGETFDAVLLGDVLEHLKGPGALLVYIRQAWLKPGGCVVLSVPNSGHWLFRREVLFGRFPYRQLGLFDQTHLRFFTSSSLQALVETCDYAIDRFAFSVNHNTDDDLTFACLARLYQRPAMRVWLVRLERQLAKIFPTLFAYQFILRIKPRTTA